MKSIAVITARGGSKRIPKKNIKEFCGKPIIAYSIIAARESGLFDDVMVSTDDEEIAQVAREYGASVPFMRSAATSDDFATTRDVLEEVLRDYSSRGQEFDYMCCIYPTAPFVTPEKLQKVFNLMVEKDADDASPLVRYSYPPQRAFYIRDDVKIACHPEMMPMRSQDLEPIFHDAGQFYFYKLESFFGKKENYYSLPVEFPESEVQDIDNLEDWTIAELKYDLMVKRLGKG
jgi:N-acylneuraminate cytidylyltransferase